MLPELKTLLTYKNVNVLQRYTREFPNAKLSAKTVFSELMKYMWLTLKAQADGKAITCTIHEEMIEIDNMWHTFLLFTRDYQQFCVKYLGVYFHHSPNAEEQIPISDEKYAEELTNYLNYIYENLGEKTVKIWFADKLSP